jgi:UDP-glucose:(heptosyl)LPS alpha-1,3-glucosyltransferase
MGKTSPGFLYEKIAMTKDRRLRIALLVHDYNRHAGHSRYVAELASRFRRNHDVHVFTNTVDDADIAGITFHHVPAWRRNTLSTIVTFVLPATVLVRGSFDIVHAQGLCGLRQNVITSHICQPAWFEAADRYGEPANWRKRVFRAIVTRLDRLVLRPGAAARFIAPSRRVSEDLADHYSLGNRVRVVYHGTDIETFHPRNRLKWRAAVRAELGFAANECVALYVGDMQKAMPAAVRALAHVADVKLVAVSRTEPAAYKALAAEAGVGARVLFVAPSREISRYYAAADLFVFPTFYDAFGLVLTEAMATGLPVVSSRAAGAAELIEHGVNGWLTNQPWDPVELASGIRTLAADSDLRERLGTAARAVIEQHTWDQAADETMAVYREVVAETGPRRPEAERVVS